MIDNETGYPLYDEPEVEVCDSCNQTLTSMERITCDECLLNKLDLTPWCTHCGAMRKLQCDCGPLPDNF